jgi:hypothetical protein
MEVARGLADGMCRSAWMLTSTSRTRQPLTDSERREAQGLVDLAHLLSLLRLRAE